MFKDYLNLIDIDLSLFDTRDVNNLEKISRDCNNLTNLDLLSSFSTNNIVNMSRTFSNCKI